MGDSIMYDKYPFNKRINRIIENRVIFKECKGIDIADIQIEKPDENMNR